MIEAPAWLRRGRTPQGQVMTRKERRTLRALLVEADEDGWVYKSRDYLAHETKNHPRTISRHLRRFEAWGIAVEETREIAGRSLRGWVLQLDAMQPRPREKVVAVSEYRRVLDELRAAKRRHKLLLETMAASTVAANDAHRDVEAFARRLAAAQVFFLEVEVSGRRERVYGPREQLDEAVAAGLAPAVHTESLWPVELGVLPLDYSRSMTRSLASLTGRERESVIEETLWWYRADLADDPRQLRYFGPHLLYKDQIWLFAMSRAYAARQRHRQKLAALLQQEAARKGLTLIPERVMCPEEFQVDADLLAQAEAFEASRMRAAAGLDITITSIEPG